MTVNKRTLKKTWADPDDGPEFTAETFARADFHIGERLIRRGRPPSDNKKIAISARFDSDIVEAFRKMGPGWQTQMNTVLRSWLRRNQSATKS